MVDQSISLGSDVGSVTTRRRMLVRRDPPVWPFVWRGLLPVLGLLALVMFAAMPFARDWIEASVRQEIRSALDAQGMQWASLDVSGQHVRLGGTTPGNDAGDLALAVARGATCPTWLGRRVCAVEMAGRFDAAPTKPPPAAAEAVSLAVACDKRFAAIMSGTRIEFATNSAVISPASEELLARLAEAHRQCPGVVAIEGHTDSVGDAGHNQALSEARAAAVREALVGLGVPGDRLAATGFGAQRPVASNDTPVGRAKNRRIEFRAVVQN